MSSGLSDSPDKAPAGIEATDPAVASAPSRPEPQSGVTREKALEVKRTYLYLSRRGFLSLSVIHPVYQAVRALSNVLQLLRDYATNDHVEFNIPLAGIWPFRRMTLTLDGDAITFTFPSLPSFIRKRVKFDAKKDPVSTFKRFFIVLVVDMVIWRLLTWPFWAVMRLTYRIELALIRCWSGTLRRSVGTAPALLALFVIVFTTGDAWRFFGLEPTARFLTLVVVLIGLSVAALVTSLMRAEGGWRANACKIAEAEDYGTLLTLVSKTPAKNLITPDTQAAAVDAPPSPGHSSDWISLNIYILFWFTLLSHLLSIGLLVSLVFILVGLVAVNADSASSLVGGSGRVTTYWHFKLLGQQVS